MKIRSGSSFGRSLFLVVLFFSVLIAFGAVTLLSVHAQAGTTPYFHTSTLQRGGHTLTKYIISGPPHPPAGYEVRPAVSLPEPGEFSTAHILTVPAFDWVFGCSSVSGSMIAGYYDRNGFPNIYTGPTGGGVMPLDNSSWGTWSDGVDTYPNIPLAASHQGVDGRTIKGSIDDYWVQYNSVASDPYITGSWTQHTWGESIGDYMKTSQSAFSNSDGSTSFYNYTDVPDPGPLTCADMEGYSIANEDGTYGRKLFYEARGYQVTDCYSWRTDNNNGGFTYAMYKAEINAGNPVMLNLAGHTIVGVGYDDASNTIYIHDTWDYSNHTMTWGGSYSGMQLLSVSIVHIQLPVPAAFNKISPANGAPSLSPSVTLSWQAASGATSYRYCIDADNNGACNSTWVDAGMNTSVPLTGLSVGTHSWQVRAVNSVGSTYANSDTWWSFTVASVTIRKTYLPVLIKPVLPPGAFQRLSPTNGATINPTNNIFSWTASDSATSYDFCISPTQGGCVASWINVGTSTTANIASLAPGTTYFWLVRANNLAGSTFVDNGNWFTVTTMGPPGAFYRISPTNMASGYSSMDFYWTASPNATSYDFCINTDQVGCISNWQNLGNYTSVNVTHLIRGMTYFWLVRANNSYGSVLVDNGTWFVFNTVPLPGCLVDNCDFESGPSSFWTRYSTHGFQIITTSFPGLSPHGGSWAAWLGGNYSDTSYITQDVYVYPSAPFLSYWIWIASAESGCYYDTAYVYVNSDYVYYNLCQTYNTGGWVRNSLNLSAYAGQWVTIKYKVTTDSSINSNFFLDDISFQSYAAADTSTLNGPINIDPQTFRMVDGTLEEGPLPVKPEPDTANLPDPAKLYINYKAQMDGSKAPIH